MNCMYKRRRKRGLTVGFESLKANADYEVDRLATQSPTLSVCRL